MALPAFEGFHHTFYFGGGGQQSTLPTGTVEGDYLVVVVRHDADWTTIQTDSIPEPVGWAVIANGLSGNNTNPFRGKLFGKFAGASEPTNTSFGFTADFSHVVTMRISGVDTTTPFGQVSLDDTNTGGVHTFLTIDVLDDTLALAMAHVSSGGGVKSTPSGWTLAVQAQGSDLSAEFVYWERDFASAQTISTFTSTADNVPQARQSILLALNGVSAGVPIPVFRNHYRMLQKR